MTLLEEAKKAERSKPRTEVTKEDMEVAFAWLSSEIGTGGLSKVYKGHGGTVLYKIAIILRDAYRQGHLTFDLEKKVRVPD